MKNQSRQASNALNLLLGQKQMTPDVQAETEKCLLVSTEKYNALRKVTDSMIGKIKSDSRGQITVSDLTIKANKKQFAEFNELETNWVIGTRLKIYRNNSVVFLNSHMSIFFIKKYRYTADSC